VKITPFVRTAYALVLWGMNALVTIGLAKFYAGIATGVILISWFLMGKLIGEYERYRRASAEMVKQGVQIL